MMNRRDAPSGASPFSDLTASRLNARDRALTWPPSIAVCSIRGRAFNHLFSLLPAGLSARASRNAPAAARWAGALKAGREASCLSSGPRKRSACGTLKNRVERRVIFRFSRRMIRADKPVSKLCAGVPAPRSGQAAPAACLRSNLARGGGTLPVASPPVCRCGRQRKPCPFPHLRLAAASLHVPHRGYAL